MDAEPNDDCGSGTPAKTNPINLTLSLVCPAALLAFVDNRARVTGSIGGTDLSDSFSVSLGALEQLALLTLSQVSDNNPISE